MPSGRVNLETWQKFVRMSAEQAWGSREKVSGPLFMQFTFYAVTPPGHRHGELWDVRVEWDRKTKKWVKRHRDGRPEPDLTNLQKAAEDAVASVVCINDVQNRFISSGSLYGRQAGVVIIVSQIEGSDFPGGGEVVQ